MQRGRWVPVRARCNYNTPHDFFRNANAQHDESQHSQNFLRTEPYSLTVSHQFFFEEGRLPNEQNGRQDPRIGPQKGTGGRYEGAKQQRPGADARREHTRYACR
ncbi:hypothetical protein COCMIDRAFT_30198 [Bipolaris oryzae ATCC 44560]|uniref:Uncharacterized protein n=1 Tax=Bipolaris oryzae ATCC 44560 TaxID=930090 RepID=W6YTW2_COCMI|nr:uncharacterized protein COCMIDRAFT_30198 [Bipolaris oryzae ATCC 44560]EUC40973.1 hypothetical protein COCMIDRAFT_30198 [Bipolaris oryzae ATCC 44560]